MRRKKQFHYNKSLTSEYVRYTSTLSILVSVSCKLEYVAVTLISVNPNFVGVIMKETDDRLDF